MSSEFSLSTGSLLGKRESVMVPRAGFEHATTRSSAERSPGLSYLGTQSWDDAPPNIRRLFSLCHGYLFTFSFYDIMLVELPQLSSNQK